MSYLAGRTSASAFGNGAPVGVPGIAGEPAQEDMESSNAGGEGSR